MRGRHCSEVAFTAFAALVSLLVLAPLLWMVSVSLMQPGAAAQFPPPLLPAHPTLDNYRTLFQDYGIGRYAFNSLLVSVLYFAGGLLQKAKVIDIDGAVAMIWVFPLLCLIYGVAKMILTRRYL